MNFKYTYKDKNDNTMASDSSTVFVSEADFRAYRRNEMKQMPNVHYCEYCELGVRNARLKTIANF